MEYHPQVTWHIRSKRDTLVIIVYQHQLSVNDGFDDFERILRPSSWIIIYCLPNAFLCRSVHFGVMVETLGRPDGLISRILTVSGVNLRVPQDYSRCMNGVQADILICVVDFICSAQSLVYITILLAVFKELRNSRLRFAFH